MPSPDPPRPGSVVFSAVGGVGLRSPPFRSQTKSQSCPGSSEALRGASVGQGLSHGQSEARPRPGEETPSQVWSLSGDLERSDRQLQPRAHLKINMT